MSFVSVPVPIMAGLPTSYGLSMKELIVELEKKAPVTTIEHDLFPLQTPSDEDIIFVDSVVDDINDE